MEDEIEKVLNLLQPNSDALRKWRKKEYKRE